jgi:molybdopterin-guanine dinucleotide biosynthesis protein B
MKISKKKTFPPFVSVVGNSGSGKTTFLEKLIPELVGRGLKVGTIKHDVHGFEMDKPGKDSWRHKHAGSSATVISSPYQIGMVMDVEHDHKPDELLLLFNGMDIILAEGYKRGDHPKIEIFRTEIIKEPLCKNDKFLLALVTDSDVDFDVPIFSSGATKAVADFLIKHFHLAHAIKHP